MNSAIYKKRLMQSLSALLITLISNVSCAQDTPSTEPTPQESTQAEPSTTPEVREQPIYANRENRDMRLLAKRLDPNSVVWLDALGEQFLAIHEQEYSGAPQGAVLILHAEGQHGSWPTTIERIRSSLPKYGWSTLSMALPQPDQIPLPRRDDPTINIKPASSSNTEADSETAGSAEAPAEITEGAEAPQRPEAGEDQEIYDDSSDNLSDGSALPPPLMQEPIPDAMEIKIPAEDRTIARLEAALDYLNAQGQFNIVLLGDGIGAARAGNFFKTLPVTEPENPDEEAVPPVRAMIILNGRNYTPMREISLINSLYDPNVATLDVYFGADPRNQHEALDRKKYAQRQEFAIYQQIKLPEMAGNTLQGENRLSRRIRGFIQKHARGQEVDDAIVTKR